jgi:hypothetical protein
VRVAPFSGHDPDEFAVEDTSRHSAIVVDQDNAPLQDISVELWVRQSSQDNWGLHNHSDGFPGERMLKVVTTDHRGIAYLDPIPRGSFRLVARSPDAIGMARWLANEAPKGTAEPGVGQLLRGHAGRIRPGA